MAQRLNRKNKKVSAASITPQPKIYDQPTETANIPLMQADGSLKYTDAEGLMLMMESGTINITDQPS